MHLKGTIIDDQSPLYLRGLYVDKFIYFSQSKEIEEEFESKFQKHVLVSFESYKIKCFLGVRILNKWYEGRNANIQVSQTACIDKLC